MRNTTVALLVIALAGGGSGGDAALADAAATLTGTWTLDERSSDDPLLVLRDDERGDGLGRRVARGVSIFGIPVGNLPRSANDEPVEPDEDLPGVEHLFESTYRLSIDRQVAVTQIRYGHAPTIDYRDGERVERDGTVASSEWQDGVLAVEHELAEGTRVSERYWYVARTEELHWTVRLKRHKAAAVNIERVFYRARTAVP
jgi:hypothetical protein